MNRMGELNLFLWLQIQQPSDGIFINLFKYAVELIKKFVLESVKKWKIPMSTTCKLDKDKEGTLVDQRLYRSIIGSLFYLTMSRVDIMLRICLYGQFQANPKKSHLKVL